MADVLNDTQCAETPMSDHVARFWRHLETETVRIMVDLKRMIAIDAPDGPVVYWDGASFSDDVAKALVAENKRMRTALEGIAVFCSGDDRTICAIERLAAVRNTAECALR